MIKFMMVFAAGYWVGSRRATGAPIVTPEMEQKAREAIAAGQDYLVAVVDDMGVTRPPRALPSEETATPVYFQREP